MSQVCEYALDPSVSLIVQTCGGPSVPATLVEDMVWRAVSDALQRPKVLMREYERRLREGARAGNLDREGNQITLALKRVATEEDSRSDLVYLELFCWRVPRGLEGMTFVEKQTLLRLLVKRITISDNKCRIETVIPTDDTSDLVQLRTRHPALVE